MAGSSVARSRPGAPPEERAARAGVLRCVFTIRKQIVLWSRFFIMIRLY